MSAICHLYVGEDKLPKWTEYEEGEKVVFESNYLVPIFWLAMFCEQSLVLYLDPDGESEDPENNRVPMLIRTKEECLSALDDRYDLIKSVFSKSTEYMEFFKKEIEKLEGLYLSVDMMELYYFVDDLEEFILDIKNTLKMFAANNIDDLVPLLRMADIHKYDEQNIDYIPNEVIGEYEYHLYGIKCS